MTDLIQMFIAALLASKVVTPEKAAEIEETFAGRSGGTVSQFIGGAMTGNLQDIAYGDLVFVDSAAAGGTTYPAGTRRYPCATLLEARTVAVAQGLNKICLLPAAAAYTLDADMENYTFVGGNFEITGGNAVELDVNGFSIDGSRFIDVVVYGDAFVTTANQIMVDGGTYGMSTNEIDAYIRNAHIQANATILPTNNTTILNSIISGNRALPTIFDLTALTGAAFIVSDCKGFLTLTNVADAAARVYIVGGAGRVTIGATNTAGQIYIIGGDWEVDDAAAGAVTITITSTIEYLETLATRLSAARAGYIDELAAANIPADVDGLKTSRDRTRCSLRPVGSALIEEVSITDGATDTALGSIVVNTIPNGATPTFAQLIFVYGAIENTAAGVNKLAGAQDIQIQKGAGAWADAIAFPDDFFTLAGATREGGGVIFGTINLSGTVTGNDTYNIQWDEAVADADFLLFNNVQVLLYIEYSI